MTKTFADLGLSPELLESISEAGFVNPFPIQEAVIPLALTGADIIGQAKTGTGKTLGFGLPILNNVKRGSGKAVALVVVPTRELGIQVADELSKLSSGPNLRVTAIYGGRPMEPQIAELKKGVDIVVGTPGRLLDLHRQKALDLSEVKHLVLDEADEMLDLGFMPDVEKIFNLTSSRSQTMLFSATMPGDVVTLARKFLNQPTHIRAEVEDSGAVVSRIKQFVYRAHALDKPEMLAKILQADGRGPTMVFCRTKRACQQIADDMQERGFKTAAIHGDLGQGARESALKDFKSLKRDILVATDVAARGIDIDGITHVINYQCPEDEKTYVHRIGRTARAGASGIAVTFVDWDELTRWSHINQALDLGFPEPQETYSSSDHLYTDLGIAKETKSRIAKTKVEKKEPVKKSERPVREKRERTRTKRVR
ncbi:MAG: DEAD/DEAH box helicase [Actinobacteria bacterium]|nr:DEAD/DEAH box helicase [Actinomycetota bacterium]